MRDVGAFQYIIYICEIHTIKSF